MSSPLSLSAALTSDELRVVLEVDRVEQVHLDELPHESEHEMRVLLTLDELGRADVGDLDTDGLRRGDDEGLVLVDLEERDVLVVLAQVQRARVDRVRDGDVDELCEEDTIADLLREVEALRRHRQKVRQVLVAIEVGSQVLRERSNLLLGISMDLESGRKREKQCERGTSDGRQQQQQQQRSAFHCVSVALTPV